MAHIEDRWEKVVSGTRTRTDRYGKGERWRARYFDPNGRERARTFARKSDAEKFLAGVESDKSRGLYVDPSAGRITVGEYAVAWQAAQVHRRTTAAAFDSHLRNHILPLLGHRPMGAVTRSEIQGWVKSRSALLAPSTTTLVYSVLRMIFRSAVADRVIAVSPCERITLPKAPPSEVQPLPVEGDRDALLERDRHLVRVARDRRVLRVRVEVLCRCAPRVLERSGLHRTPPHVLVDRDVSVGRGALLDR